MDILTILILVAFVMGVICHYRDQSKNINKNGD